ncbi:right-handed parallel beta-helix repeat-containing protein [bacterium]|nr:right-handed parallel beta-helix repeat-containing protein [bacterium]
MRSSATMFCVVAVMLLLLAVPAGAYLQTLSDDGGEGSAVVAPARGWPGGGYFPNHDPDYILLSITNNDYRAYTAGDTPVFPHGYYIKYPCFNADGTKLAVVARTKIDGVSDPYEVWVCDYDATTHTISNPAQVTSTGGTGDVAENKMCSWSRTNPDLLMFLEAHITQPNPIKTYDFSSSTFATLYDPALDTNGFDATNPGFYAQDDTKIIVGSGYNTGSDRILLFDGTYPSTTISSLDMNLDPSSSYDGTRVSYYSTNSAYPYPAGSIYAAYSASVWTENVNGWGDPATGNVPGLWAFYSGDSDDELLSLRSDLGWTSTALALYASDGTLISDLTGDAGTDFQWIYANHGWKGPGGEILFRAEEYSHTGYGNNMFLALDPPSVVWVDDSWTGPDNCGGHSWGYDAFSTIQAGVDAVSGSTVNVAAGTYREQVKIDGKSLDLIGPIVGTAVVEAVDVIDRTTYSITQWTGDSRSIDACIGVVGPATVNISGLTVDGRELGPDNFYGVHFFDASGSVTDCRIEDVVYTADPGASRIVSLAASQSDAVASYTIEFSDNVIPNFQKCGILVMGPDFTFTVDGNEITDVPSDIIAGNGIQLSYGATGTMSDNVVQGVGYTGGDWSGSGILLFESGSISMDGDEVLDCETGVAFDDWGWIHVHPSQVALDFVDLNLHDNEWTLGVAVSRDGSDVDVDIIDCIVANSGGDGIDLYGTGADPWGGSYYTGLDNGSLVARISGCTITNAAGDGIWVDDLSGNATNTIDVSVNQTGLSGNVNSALWNGQSDEVDAEYCWWGDPAGPTVVSRDGGTRMAAPRVSPYGADLPEQGESRSVDSGMSRAGDGVHGVVDYTPWLTGNIVCDLDPEYLTAADPTKTVTVKYLGGGSDDVFGYSIKFAWDGAVVSTTTGDVNEGALLSDLGGTFFYAANGIGDEIVVDCALLGSIAGATGPGTLFTIDFTGLAVGTSDIDVEILNVRDQYNNPLSGFYEDDGLLIVDVSVTTIAGVAITNTTIGHTNDYIKDTDGVQVTATVLDDDPTFGAGDIVADLSGFGIVTPANPGSYNWTTGAAVWTIVAPTGVTCSPANGDVWVYVDATDAIGNPAAQGSDDIIADNTPPTAVTNLDAAPGHQKCDLSWTMGTDTYLDGVVVQRNANVGDYPVYPLFVAAWPVVTPYYPATHLLGTNVYTGAAAVATDAVIDRNIYSYQAFCFDIARNYGAAEVAGASADLATNYWLGDVAATMGAWGYNGLVNDADIDKLGFAYHAAPAGSPVDEMDVGPTVHPNYGRLGLPTPDNFVGFEDLMMFAMNYGMVIPRVVPLLSEPVEGQLALSLEQISSDAAGVVELALRLDGNVGDVKGISAVFELDGMEFVSARLSDEMNSPVARTFLWAGDNQIDLAILGTDVSIGGSGELARLTFQATSDEYGVGFASATLRGVENGMMDAGLEGYISKDDIPATFRLVQNAPNPFNPMTTIAFNVPHESRVAIRVYDVSGRVVRTLVDGVTEPGRHAAVWDGRNDHGESCGSGVYFCVMETPEYRGSHKMMLLK